MDSKLKLIFVHVPKTGGNSVRASIVDKFSAPMVLRDYSDRPDDPSSPMNIDPVGFLARSALSRHADLTGKAAVVGHFWIRKYDGVAADVRATVLRDPLERTMSHYFYWMKREGHGQLLHDHVRQHNLSLMEFASLPTIRWFYTQIFFRDVDMGQFDVIGRFDKCVKDWSELLRDIGLKTVARVRHLNATAGLDELYAARRHEILTDEAMMARLRDLLADDIKFYERHARD
jgi:Sulfotransferase family